MVPEPSIKDFEGLCYRTYGSGEFLVAAFRYASEAESYVERQSRPARWVIRNAEGTKIIGTTSHGWAILEKTGSADNA